MSPSARNSTLLGSVIKRSYVSQASPKAAVSSYGLKTALLENKLPIVVLNPEFPLSTLTVAFKAGARYEQPDNIGITNILRSSVGLSAKNVTKFRVTRQLEQLGVSLFSTVDREVFSYTLLGSADAMWSASEILGHIVSEPNFRPWEMQENVRRIKLELNSITDEALAVDLMHQAAYRSGLGNSLFVPEHRIGKINSEDLLHYIGENFTSERGVVASIGVQPENLQEFAKFLNLKSGSGPSTKPSTYYGGELRSPSNSEIVNIAVGAEAPGFTKTESLAYGILSHIYARPAPFKYSNCKGVLGDIISSLGNEGFSITPINASYSDSGLIGFLLTSSSTFAPKAIQSAVRSFLKGTVTDKEIALGKYHLKTSLLHSCESGADLLHSIAKQIGQPSALLPDQVASLVDSVSNDAVKQAAKKVASSKLSVGVVGNASKVSYIDTIKA